MFSGAQVLIAEDNPYLALDLSIALEDMDGRVVGPVSSVADALTLLAQNDLSAAIVDLQLAGHDASSLLHHLSERGVPFIIHSAMPVPASVRALHPDAPVLTKPLKPETVLTRLLEEMNNAGQQLPATPLRR